MFNVIRDSDSDAHFSQPESIKGYLQRRQLMHLPVTTPLKQTGTVHYWSILLTDILQEVCVSKQPSGKQQILGFGKISIFT